MAGELQNDLILEKKPRKIINPLNFFKKPLIRYIVQRIFNSMITLFFIITAVFLLLRMMPKDRYINYDIVNKLPVNARDNYIKQTYEKYGLNDPVYVQLFRYYKDILPIPKEVCVKDKFDDNWNPVCVETRTVLFNFGESIKYKEGKPVVDIMMERFPISFRLSIWAVVAMYTLAYPLGVVMAKNKGKLIDKLGNGYIIATIAVPALIYYYMWQIIGMKVLNLPSIFVKEDIASWIMPIWAIVFVSLSGSALWVRRFMVDEINSDYVRFARSKGLTERRIMFTHVLRNAIVPLVRGIPAAFIYSIVGSYFVEMLWSIPGSGGLLITGLTKVDNTLVQALAILYATMSMTAFLLGDLITVFFDPRISLTKNK